jgi:hypothetical protein
MGKFTRVLGLVSFLAVSLAGCGKPSALSTGVAEAYQSRTAATTTKGVATWMLSEAQSEDLLYVSSSLGTSNWVVLALTYPQGKLVGTLTGFTQPKGICTDKKGNVFVANSGQQNIIEYAHAGTKPIATLGNTGGYPIGCAVDPTTGNLAVAIENPTVVVYKKARGFPTAYNDPEIGGFFYCTYDASGNLFADGQGRRVPAVIDELVRGGKTLRELSLNTTINAGGGIQWAGKYLVVEDPRGREEHGADGPTSIDQFKIFGSTGVLVKTIELSDGKNDRNPGTGTEFWIEGSFIVSPRTRKHGVDMWRYPAGGNPVARFHDAFPYAVAISLARNSSL